MRSHPRVSSETEIPIRSRSGDRSFFFTAQSAEKLFSKQLVIPIYHALPHKGVFPLPMRPIVAGMGSMGERLSTWVDQLLQPLVQALPVFLHDSKDAINKMEMVA